MRGAFYSLPSQGRWPSAAMAGGALAVARYHRPSGKHRAGHARPLQRSKMKGKAPHHVIFNARCTRYTMYLNSPAIRLNSTQT